ncbi:MAG: PfkB family carbohydrate kinase [Cyanobium sp.]
MPAPLSFRSAALGQNALAAVPLPLAQLPVLPSLRLAVVGHVEVVRFVEVASLPRPGEIVRALHVHEVPAGGGAVVAVQLARLLGQPVPFFTSLGRDAIGERAVRELTALGLDLQVAWREAPTREAITYVDAAGERTITVIGERLTPTAADPLPWCSLAGCDGVFLTAADAAAIRLARAARVLTATPRTRLAVLREAAVPLEALIGSALDPAEHYNPGELDPEPSLLIATEGAAGGRVQPGGRFSAPRRPGPVRDTYGAGDSFAAGVTAGLAAGWSLAEALSLGCHCGSACLDGRGPYAGQLRRRVRDGRLSTPEPPDAEASDP